MRLKTIALIIFNKYYESEENNMKNKSYLYGKIITPANVSPWPHEKRIAKILALAGYAVEFIPKGLIGSADIYLNGVAYEIKSPKSNKTNTIEHRIKEAVNNQSCNLIIDSSRIKNMKDYNLQKWLIERCCKQPQIKSMLFVNKKGQIIDIKSLI